MTTGLMKLLKKKIVSLKEIERLHLLVQTDNVFLFIPNIIDYMRVLMLISFICHAAVDSYGVASICYFISFALDELDGNSARFFKQTSVFGMMLDILIDEVSVLFLCMVLSTIYPKYIIVFQLYSAIDFSAQWATYQFAALYRNNQYNDTDDCLINIYFNNYIMTLIWVYGNHMFLLMLYLCHFTCGPNIWVLGFMDVGLWELMAYLAGPCSVSRLCIMMYLLVSSMYNLGREDQHKRLHEKMCTNGHVSLTQH